MTMSPLIQLEKEQCNKTGIRILKIVGGEGNVFSILKIKMKQESNCCLLSKG